MMKILLSILLIIVSFSFGFSQVGINTTDPDASAALDIVNDERGVLIPRMTTSEIDAIVNPAHSLLVYDTDLEGYYFNQGTPTTPNWVLLLTDVITRDNYVIVKTLSDFPAASGGTITLDENTLYEVNGTITLSQSIDVNGAYLIGKDTNEDVLNYTGNSALFTGSANASFRNITFNNSNSGSLFNLTAFSTNSLIAQSVVVNGFSSVGTVEGYGLVFFNVVQYLNNSDGITYTDISNLLLNNMGWQPSNGGSYETFTGTFEFIQKVSGFTTVGSGATGLDVGSNPTVSNGALKSVVFSGVGNYVNPYTGTGTYAGYNFTNDWAVDCIGIPREDDDNASGNIYITRNSTTSNPSFNIASAAPINASIDPGEMFRFSNSTRTVTGSNNVLKYEGKETRTFSVSGNLSYQSTNIGTNGNATVHVFFIQKFDSNGNNASVPLGTEVYSEVGAAGDNLVRAIPLGGKVTLDPGDYVRIYGQFISATGTARNNIKVYSVSLTLE